MPMSGWATALCVAAALTGASGIARPFTAPSARRASCRVRLADAPVGAGTNARSESLGPEGGSGSVRLASAGLEVGPPRSQVSIAEMTDAARERMEARMEQQRIAALEASRHWPSLIPDALVARLVAAGFDRPTEIQ
ncbi:hypothetical protein T492DRAFT_854216 [Pavlovales sp. CCMP2436]|nr:hypothetical protein T492DRAFT_854216 [Pavlovales sp. CCMP2436]